MVDERQKTTVTNARLLKTLQSLQSDVTLIRDSLRDAQIAINELSIQVNTLRMDNLRLEGRTIGIEIRQDRTDDRLNLNEQG